MRYTPSEKYEIIKLVEESDLSITNTLKNLGLHRSTFYSWYQRYQCDGVEGLVNKYCPPKKQWNALSEKERDRVKEIALEYPEKSPRELAWFITDNYSYYVSESTVYRVLKTHDLITSPVYTLYTASDKFKNPTVRVNELWQTDFTYFKIIHWGWYYLSTVLDDYSRYIISWKLCSNMGAEDVENTLDEALAKTEINHVKVRHRPRLLSDNGPCYISKSLKDYLSEEGIKHTRGRPYHPMTQGKIERYHRTMKNIINLENYHSPGELEDAIGRFVAYYNNQRYHESLNNLTPADVYFAKMAEKENKRESIKQATIQKRRKRHSMYLTEKNTECYL